MLLYKDGIIVDFANANDIARLKNLGYEEYREPKKTRKTKSDLTEKPIEMEKVAEEPQGEPIEETREEETQEESPKKSGRRRFV